MRLPEGPICRLGARGNVEGEFGKAGKPVLAAARALPGDRAGLWEGCAGEFLVLLLSRAAVSGSLDYDCHENGFLAGHPSPGKVALDT